MSEGPGVGRGGRAHPQPKARAVQSKGKSPRSYLRERTRRQVQGEDSRED